LTSISALYRLSSSSKTCVAGGDSLDSNGPNPGAESLLYFLSVIVSYNAQKSQDRVGWHQVRMFELRKNPGGASVPRQTDAIISTRPCKINDDIGLNYLEATLTNAAD
jgi:hypothetical protein